MREALALEGRAVAGALAAHARRAPRPLTVAALVRWCRVDGESGLESDAAAALEAVLDEVNVVDGASAADWMVLCAEAAPLAPDSRIAEHAARAAAAIRATPRAPVPGDVRATARLLDACFRAAALIDGPVVAEAVDELERIVGATYRPGQATAQSFGALMALASALLSAFEISGRLPYSMLAEELVETSRRRLWDPDEGGFLDAPGTTAKPFVANCEAGSVLARLARLHDSAEYRQVAVTTPDADYAALATRTVASQATEWRSHGDAAAHYAFAVAELADLSGGS